jgi:adenylosuccinate lyase
MRCWDEKRGLREVMLEDEEASRIVTEADLDDWLRPENYVGTAVEQVDLVVGKLREMLDDQV